MSAQLPNKPLERTGVNRRGESVRWWPGRSAPIRYAHQRD